MHLSDLIELLQKQITLAVLTKIKGLVKGYKKLNSDGNISNHVRFVGRVSTSLLHFFFVPKISRCMQRFTEFGQSLTIGNVSN